MRVVMTVGVLMGMVMRMMVMIMAVVMGMGMLMVVMVMRVAMIVVMVMVVIVMVVVVIVMVVIMGVAVPGAQNPDAVLLAAAAAGTAHSCLIKKLDYFQGLYPELLPLHD